MDDIAALTDTSTPPPQPTLAPAQAPPPVAATPVLPTAASTSDAPIGKLKAAGFSDDEIVQWTTQKREELTHAGFSDGEIDHYFSGAVQPPTKIPQALTDRFEGGAAAVKREGGLAQTIPAGIDMLSSPGGRTKLWDGVQKWLQSTSIADSLVDPLLVPGNVASGKVDLTTPEGMDQAIGLGMMVGLGRLNKLPLTGKTSGTALAAGESMARISKTPLGEVEHVPVGGLPKGEDFLNAAHDLTGGKADQATQQKLLTLYNEKGIHPAEVAHDAKTDVTITQDIVSGNDHIDAYHASPHDFEVFDIGKIGTGEGAQSYGHGLYFAENPTVTTEYLNKFDARSGAEHDALLYRVRITADKSKFLDLDKSLNRQTPEVQAALKQAMGIDYDGNFDAAKAERLWSTFKYADGKDAVRKGFIASDDALVSQRLSEAGIPGSKYLDQGSRKNGDGTRNYVVFNDKHVEITHKNGEPATPAERKKLVAAAHQPDTVGGAADGAGGKPPEPPPPKPGMIRFYHGTAYQDASGFTGKTFVTPHYQYARDYHGGPNNVLYTDFTLAEADARGLIDEVNRYPINGSIDDGASLLKPFEIKTDATGGGKPPEPPPQFTRAVRTSDGGIFTLEPGETEAQLSKRAAGGISAREAAATKGYATPEIGYVGADGKFLSQGEKEAAASGGTGGQPPKPPPPGLPAVIEPPAPEPGSFEAAQKSILDKISIGGKDITDKLSWDKFYTHVVDDLNPIKGAVEDATKTASSKIPASENAYKLGRLTRGTFGKADHFLEHGTFDFNTYKTNGAGLAEILKPVRDDLNGLRAYLSAERAIEIESSGRISGMDLEAAKQVSAAGKKQYGDIAAKLSEYQHNVLSYLKDSGALSEKSFDAMTEANRNYIPFFRVMGDGQSPIGSKGFGPGSPIKHLKGSVRDIIDPLESIIKNTYAFVSIAERNAVGIKLIDTLKDASKNPTYTRKLLQNPDYKPPPVLKQIANTRDPIDGEIVQYLKDNGVKSPPPDLVATIRTAAVEPDGNTISAFRNGVKESYTTADAELVAAFKQLNRQDAGLLTKILAIPAKTLRAGAVLTPDFMAKNIIRDFTTALVNSKGVFTPIDTIKGLKSVISKDASFQDWLKSGGANSALVALDRNYLQHNIEKLTAQTGLGSRAWNIVKSPLDGLRMLSELAENATRLGEFKKVLGGETSKAAMQDAGYASRQVTLDFARRGASTQAYNMITAFANANIQGVARIGTAFKENPLGTSLKIAGGITLPSVLLWLANHDDPRYKEIPQWEKDLFWIVLTKNHIWRIPKDFTLGVLFGSGAEHVMEKFYAHNPDAFKGFGGSVAGTLFPSATPTFAQPVIEQFANRSTFTNRTLVPDLMERGLPEYQYTPYTTELAKKLGQIIGAFPGIKKEKLEPTVMGGVAASLSSPILIENYIRAWTGGLGTYALHAADASLRKAGVLPDPPKPASTLADIPFVKAFVVRYPSASAQSIQDFYDDYSKSQKYYTSFMDRAKEGDIAAMARIQEAGGPRMFLQLDGMKTVLGEHGQLIRDINKDPSMPPQQKRQLIDQLYYSMIQIGQEGKAALRQIDNALAHQ